MNSLQTKYIYLAKLIIFLLLLSKKLSTYTNFTLGNFLKYQNQKFNTKICTLKTMEIIKITYFLLINRISSIYMSIAKKVKTFSTNFKQTFK